MKIMLAAIAVMIQVSLAKARAIVARIGFDFDGTLAVWPRDIRVDYGDPSWAMTNAAAVLGTIKWLKAALARGHDVVIITGRGRPHKGPLRYWLFNFTGCYLDVVTRPMEVGLDKASQAEWKAQVIRKLGVEIYVGDNLEIDREAANKARIRFLDARGIRAGVLPPLQLLDPSE